MLNLWNDGSFDLAMIQGVPVNGFEERMGFDQSSAAFALTRDVTKPL